MQVRTTTRSGTGPQTAMVTGDRFSTMIRLADYSPCGIVHESTLRFDSGLRFGPAFMTVQAPCPARWFGQKIELAVAAATAADAALRPLHILAPAPALGHVATLGACLRAVSTLGICAQELCLTFSNSVVSADTGSALASLRRLREAGFRLGIDARQSSCALAHPALRLLVETVHVDARQLSSDSLLRQRTLAADKDGLTVIAHHAAWRDRAYLMSLGVRAVKEARSDA